MTNNSIQSNSRITLNFSLKLEDGSIVESNFGMPAVQFKFGDGNLLPNFENRLLGMQNGERKVFYISAEQAFGTFQEGNVHKVDKLKFPLTMPLEIGAVVLMNTGKSQAPAVVKAVDDRYVTVDFNHPLASKPIVFEVFIVAVD